MVDDGIPRYDRDFLLSPAKRNQIVELWEVARFGRDSFGDPAAVSLYGMTPAEWHARGIRLLARTTLEAVRDPLGNRIGEDVAHVAATAPQGSAFGVVDPFAGSCNGLFWILPHVGGAKGIGFEFEQTVFDMTCRNIASLGAPIQLVHGDYRMLLGQHRFPAGHHIVAFLAPPWADALGAETALDLRRTKPPVGNIVDDFERLSEQPDPLRHRSARALGTGTSGGIARKIRMVGIECLRYRRPYRTSRRAARHQTMECAKVPHLIRSESRLLVHPRVVFWTCSMFREPSLHI
jgi:hypothetical protein